MKKLFLLFLVLMVCSGTPLTLTDSIVYAELQRQGVLFPEIVLAQAKLETGNYTSKLCKTKNNIFGLKGKNGYRYFKNYKECITFYKEKIQSRYKGGDYYVFLTRIGYAKDKSYISKLKKFKK